MGLNDVVATFNTDTLVVQRVSSRAVVDGRVGPDVTTTFNIEASVQPTSGAMLNMLPVGRRIEDTRVLYTLTELRVKGAIIDPDQVTIDGENWSVVNVKNWRGFRRDDSATMFECLVARQESV